MRTVVSVVDKWPPRAGFRVRGGEVEGRGVRGAVASHPGHHQQQLLTRLMMIRTGNEAGKPGVCSRAGDVANQIRRRVMSTTACQPALPI